MSTAKPFVIYRERPLLHALAEDGEDFGAGEGAVADGEDEDGKSGYIDKTGAMTIPPQFDAAYDFNPNRSLEDSVVTNWKNSNDRFGFNQQKSVKRFQENTLNYSLHHSDPRVSYLVLRLFTACSPLVHRSRGGEETVNMRE